MDLFAVPVPGTRGASRGVAFAFSRDAQTLAGGLPAAGSALRWALQSCWVLCQAAAGRNGLYDLAAAGHASILHVSPVLRKYLGRAVRVWNSSSPHVLFAPLIWSCWKVKGEVKLFHKPTSRKGGLLLQSRVLCSGLALLLRMQEQQLLTFVPRPCCSHWCQNKEGAASPVFFLCGEGVRAGKPLVSDLFHQHHCLLGAGRVCMVSSNASLLGHGHMSPLQRVCGSFVSPPPACGFCQAARGWPSCSLGLCWCRSSGEQAAPSRRAFGQRFWSQPRSRAF